MTTSLHPHLTTWDADWRDRFPARLTGRQKTAFLDELERQLQARHFDTERLTVRLLLQNRLLLTRCAAPRVIFMAHIDTPTIIPPWYDWLFRLLGQTRQITALVVLLAFLYLPSIVDALFGWESPLLNAAFGLLQVLFLLSHVTLFIPNPRNREDNTSGVLALLALAEWLQDQPDLREHVQLVFLDNEEWGLLGSNGLKQVWETRGHPFGDAAIINLDCVARGAVPLLAHHGQDALARRLLPFVQRHLPAAHLLNMGRVPLSDNYTFRQQGAVDISFANPTLIPGGYAIPRIHTPADNDFDPRQLLLLLQGLGEFVASEVAGQKERKDTQRSAEDAKN